MRVSVFHYFLKLFISVILTSGPVLDFDELVYRQTVSQSIFFSYFVSNIPEAGTTESRPSSPLFIPAKPVKKSVRRRRKHIREGRGGSTDSEDLPVAGIKETSKKKRRRGQTNQKESKGKTVGNDRGEEGQDGGGSERSSVTEKSENKVSSARREQDRATRNVTTLQTEHPPSNKTSAFPGKQIFSLVSFTPVRRDRKTEENKIFRPFKWRYR